MEENLVHPESISVEMKSVEVSPALIVGRRVPPISSRSEELRKARITAINCFIPDES